MLHTSCWSCWSYPVERSIAGDSMLELIIIFFWVGVCGVTLHRTEHCNQQSSTRLCKTTHPCLERYLCSALVLLWLPNAVLVWTMLSLLGLLWWCQTQTPRATTASFSPRHKERCALLSQPLALAFSLRLTKLKVSPLCWQLDPFWLWLPSGITVLFWLFRLDDAKQNSAEFFRMQTALWNQGSPAT